MLNLVKEAKYDYPLVGTSLSKKERKYFSSNGLRIFFYLICPYCKYNGEFMMVFFLSKNFPKEYQYPENFLHPKSRYETVKPCPKCKNTFTFKIDKNCRFEKRDYS
jgi:hypothetical protein